ncbi:hypothetical protein LXM94_11500 [Rhizobium sp. TRM95111]|uniref:hypothetical protein n=1 Tax=Rhizobium alarense TaxID=2846851 RepID=UPI001F20B782|nr:hypothetical protein [Rhizobium alarense]MCF3640589.1 hypothetical protein [Rhizobium alarense]
MEGILGKLAPLRRQPDAARWSDFLYGGEEFTAIGAEQCVQAVERRQRGKMLDVFEIRGQCRCGKADRLGFEVDKLYAELFLPALYTGQELPQVDEWVAVLAPEKPRKVDARPAASFRLQQQAKDHEALFRKRQFVTGFADQAQIPKRQQPKLHEPPPRKSRSS